MGDVVFLAIVVVFFALATAYVHGCAKLMGDNAEVESGNAGKGDDKAVTS